MKIVIQAEYIESAMEQIEKYIKENIGDYTYNNVIIIEILPLK